MFRPSVSSVGWGKRAQQDGGRGRHGNLVLDSHLGGEKKVSPALSVRQMGWRVIRAIFPVDSGDVHPRTPPGPLVAPRKGLAAAGQDARRRAREGR